MTATRRPTNQEREIEARLTRSGATSTIDSRYLVALHTDCCRTAAALQKDLNDPTYPETWRLDSRRALRRLNSAIDRLELVLASRDDVQRLDTETTP